VKLGWKIIFTGQIDEVSCEILDPAAEDRYVKRTRRNTSTKAKCIEEANDVDNNLANAPHHFASWL
jgi:hypothetical protein